MSFDPQLLALVLNERARQAESERRDALLGERRSQDALKIGMGIAMQPEADIKAWLPLLREQGLTPAFESALLDAQKAERTARKAKEAEAQTAAAGTAAAGVLTDPILAPELGLPQILSQLRAVEASGAQTPLGAPALLNQLDIARTSAQANANAVSNLRTPQQIAAEKSAQREANRQVATAERISAIKGRETGEAVRAAFGEAPNFRPDLGMAAADGKAYVDPTTGFIARGTAEGKKAIKAQGVNSLFSILAQVNATAEKFANDQGGQFGTGTFEEFKRQSGGDANPYFAALDNSRGQLQLILGQLRSGAVLTKRQEEIISKALPSDAELKLVNGKLAKSAQARMRQFGRILESELLPTFDPRDRKQAQAAIRASLQGMIDAELADTSISELSNDPVSDADNL